MEPLLDLITRRDELNVQIAERQAQARRECIVKGLEALAALGITPADLVPARVGRRANKGTVAIKYRHPAGGTWTGRGKQPVWLRTALAEGCTLDSFKV